jgi:hypothetical protein
MSETITDTTEPPGNAASGPPAGFHPVDVLLHVIATFLAPMFLTASGGDIGFARMAAMETVNAYCVRSPADLIPIAQIIAFGLAALGSLSLSMADELSLAMTLRLRGNAIACDRSAERNRRALRESKVRLMVPLHADTTPDPGGERFEAELLARVAAAQERGRAIQARMEGTAASPGQGAPASVVAPASPGRAAPTPAAAAPAARPVPTAAPIGAAPIGAAPTGAAPTGAARIGAAPIGAAPTGAAPTGAAPTGAAPTGAAPTGAARIGAAPIGAAPVAAPTGAAAMITERQIQTMWGAAMADVAAEYTTDLTSLPPAACREATVRANTLDACDNDLISGNVSPGSGSRDLGAVLR